MFAKSFFTTGLLAAAAAAQQTSPFTDPLTDITFQEHIHATSGVSFGLALPLTPGTDFIGRITAPISEGYAAVSLGGGMIGRLLVVAWPNGDSVVSSIREAEGYANPGPVPAGDQVLLSIAAGTVVGGDSFTYTFLCEGCVTGDLRSFNGSADVATFGWALSENEVADPEDGDSALNMHTGGFGLFGADLEGARSDEFATWAALAGEVAAPPNGTAPAPPSNGTAPETPVGCRSKRAKRAKMMRRARQVRARKAKAVKARGFY